MKTLKGFTNRDLASETFKLLGVAVLSLILPQNASAASAKATPTPAAVVDPKVALEKARVALGAARASEASAYSDYQKASSASASAKNSFDKASDLSASYVKSIAAVAAQAAELAKAAAAATANATKAGTASATAAKALVTGTAAETSAIAAEAKAKASIATLTTALSAAQALVSTKSEALKAAQAAQSVAEAAAAKNTKDTKLAAAAKTALAATTSAQKALDTANAASTKASDAKKAGDTAYSSAQAATAAATKKKADLKVAADQAAAALAEANNQSKSLADSVKANTAQKTKLTELLTAANAKLATAKTALATAASAAAAAYTRYSTAIASSKAAQIAYEKAIAALNDGTRPEYFNFEQEFAASVPDAMGWTFGDRKGSSFVFFNKRDFYKVSCSFGPTKIFDQWEDTAEEAPMESEAISGNWVEGFKFRLKPVDDLYNDNYTLKCSAATSRGNFLVKKNILMNQELDGALWENGKQRDYNALCGFRSNQIPSAQYAKIAAAALKPTVAFSNLQIETMPYSVSMSVASGKSSEKLELNNLYTNHKNLEQVGNLLLLRRDVATRTGCYLIPTRQKLFYKDEKNNRSWFKWFNNNNSYPEFGITSDAYKTDLWGGLNSNAAVGEVLAVTADGRGALMDRDGNIVKIFSKVSKYLERNLQGTGVAKPGTRAFYREDVVHLDERAEK